MSQHSDWVDTGQHVEARFAVGDGVHTRGKVVSYAERPTVLIERADGSTVSWIADLCVAVDPRDAMPQPFRLRPEAQVPTSDPVNYPAHYTSQASGIEVIQITEHLGFCLGNAVKYILRCDLKGKPIEDLEKAAWYLQREIERRTAAGASSAA